MTILLHSLCKAGGCGSEASQTPTKSWVTLTGAQMMNDAHSGMSTGLVPSWLPGAHTTPTGPSWWIQGKPPLTGLHRPPVLSALPAPRQGSGSSPHLTTGHLCPSPLQVTDSVGFGNAKLGRSLVFSAFQ